jgi:hypothetical protein
MPQKGFAVLVRSCFDLTPYAFHPGIRCQHELVAAIAHLTFPEEDAGQFITLLGAFSE